MATTSTQSLATSKKASPPVLRFAAFANKHLYSDMNFKVMVDDNRPWYVPAHRVVVATASLKLEQLVAKLTDDDNNIFLKDIKVEDLEELIDFIYTGRIAVRYENVTSMLKTSKYLKLTKLTQACLACRLAGKPSDDNANGEDADDDNDDNDDDNDDGDDDEHSSEDDTETEHEAIDDNDETQNEVNSTTSTAVADQLRSLTLADKKGVKKTKKTDGQKNVTEHRGRFWTNDGQVVVSSIRLSPECAEHFERLTIAGNEVDVKRNGTVVVLATPITFTETESEEFRVHFNAPVGDAKKFKTFHLTEKVTIESNRKWGIIYFGLVTEIKKE